METSTRDSKFYLSIVVIGLTTSIFFPNKISAQCLGSITLNVIATPQPEITGDTSICNGTNTILSVTGGPYDTYLWSTGITDPTLTVNSPGLYAVTVSNTNGCSSVAEQQVIGLSTPQPSITELQYECNGEITLDAGAGFSSYSWSTGDTGQTTIVDADDVYSVTVTNSDGCTGTDSYFVSIPTLPTVDISGMLNYCQGESTTLTATGGYVSYAWTGGGTGQSITVNSPGTYSVTVTDALGCTTEASETVVEDPFTQPTISGPNLLCEGESIALTAEGGPYASYLWSNGITTSTNIINSPGNYSVTVTAANGCTGIASQTVTLTAQPDPFISGNLVLCNGNNNTLTVLPTFSSYVWSTGSTNSSITVNSADVYSVTVTNALGCTGTTSANVIQGTPPDVNIVPIGTPLCEDDPAINLTASPPGGTWSGDVTPFGQINPPVLGSGTFVATYTYTDQDGCTGTDDFGFVILPLAFVTIQQAGPFCATDPIQTLVGNPAGGTWGGIANSFGQIDPSAFAPGIYPVTYTASSPGTCPDVAEIFIEIFPQPTANIQGTGFICQGSGQSFPIEITTNGTAPFQVTYTIDSNSPTTVNLFSGTNFINATTPGIYEIISVVDANGCTGTASGQASVGLVDAPTVTSLEFQCDPVQENYVATFEITGGDPSTYSVIANVPGGSISPNPPYIYTSSSIPTGDFYQFIVNDDNNCNPVTLSGNYSCDCLTDAGTMDLNELNYCEGETATAIHLGNQVLDNNDAFIFILHDGNGNTLGNVFDINSTPNFLFSSQLMTGTTYYISAVAGNDDGFGGVDLTDPCLSVSFGTPVVWDLIPMADISDDASICEDESATIVFSLSGIPPFDVSYSDGNQIFDITNIFDDHTLEVTPTETTTYTLISVEDSSNSDCTGVADGSVTVTVNPTATTNEIIEICEGESVFLEGALQTESGTYIDDFLTINGCDSTVITDLIVYPVDTFYFNTTSCDPNQAGVFTDVYSDQNGCDSTVVTTITFSENDLTFFEFTTCDPNAVGVFVDSLTNQLGCDSIVTTTITLQPNDLTEISETTCDSTQAGVFTDVFTNQDGCDSVVVTTITFIEVDFRFFEFTTCDPNQAGVFIDTLTNQFGCDSIITTTFDLLPSNATDLSETTCDSTQAGVFTEVFTNQFGCDSTVITTITFIEVDEVFLEDSTCDPDVVGVFVETLTNQFGCDSIVTTTIELLESNITELETTSCDSTQVGVFTEMLTNQNGCDSTVITTVTFSEQDLVFLEDTTCDSTQVGIFVENFVNQNGCDSVVTTTVTYVESSFVFLSDTTCDSTQAGVFTEILTNQNGCDSVITTTVVYTEPDLFFFSGTTCDPDEAGIFVETFTNQLGCDSIITTTITLLESDTIEIPDTTCDPNQAGVFTEVLTNQNGCDSTVITTVVYLGNDLIFLTDTSCDPDETGVFIDTLTNQVGCDSIVTMTITLLPSDTVEIPDTTCDPDQVGVFTEVLTNQNGCDSIVITTVSLLPPDDCGVEFLLAGNTIPCEETSGNLSIEILQGNFPITYEFTNNTGFSGNGTITESPFLLEDMPPGEYTFTLSLVNGQNSTEIFLLEQALPPQLDLLEVTSLDCSGDLIGEVEAVVSGDFGPYDFAWSNGGTTPIQSGLGAGIYEVTVSGDFGCETVGSIELINLANPDLTFVVNPLDCFDSNGGFVEAEASGGVEPYQYSLNGSAFQSENIFTGLSAGTYELTVQSSDGCETTESFAINAPMPVDVELGENLTIELGENMDITAIVNLPPEALATIEWSGLENPECPTCLTQSVTPLVTTSYSIFVESDAGCIDEDGITIFIDRTLQVYVPNAFSPNGDGVNERFFPFARTAVVEKIKTFQIFSRWGELIFEGTDFQPNDPSFGWDGTHRGQRLDAGVFVWFAEFEFIDGTIEIFKGDVTLVR